MYLYRPHKESLYSPFLGNYVSYALCAYNGAVGAQSLLQEVSDVSTDFRFVSGLAQLCTEHQLEPTHLMDVVEDTL